VIKNELIEYNTGVMFFDERARPVFDTWSKLASEVDSTLVHLQNGIVSKFFNNDQCSFPWRS
jgi:hypothetical protein